MKVLKQIFAFACALACISVAQALTLQEQLEAESVATVQRARAFTVSITFTNLTDERGTPLSGKGASSGSGSGFIVSSDGKIVTNQHVADSLNLLQVTGRKASALYSYKVTLADGKSYDAEFVAMAGNDIDLALLKLKTPPPGLSVATLNTKKLQGGETVWALGSPFGFADSASKGIVSTAERTVPSFKMHPVIQTDASINPGNSGGPLVDIHAMVIGVNTQIYSKSGGNEGIGFAIPASVVQKFLNGGAIKPKAPGFIGVTGDAIDGQTRQMFGIASNINGLRVLTVDPKGPAKGKILPGDIIQSVDGEEVKDAKDWAVTVSTKGEGTTINLKVWRNGKTLDVAVELMKVSTP